MKTKLDLSTVTLMGVSSRDVAETIEAMDRCTAIASFASTLLFSPERPSHWRGKWAPCPAFKEARGLCPWSMTQLPSMRKLFAAHVLSIHWDGFIVEPKAWSPEFLKYDFVGSPLTSEDAYCPKPSDVPFLMNNGFYLSSRRFWKSLADLRIENSDKDCHPSDRLVTGRYRPILEKLGVRFAPLQVAQKFSCTDTAWAGEFGAHGPVSLRSAPLKQDWSTKLAKWVHHGIRPPEPREAAFSPRLGFLAER